MNVFLQVSGGSIFGNIFLILFVVVVVFLIMREVMCWYYKINERISLQIETNNLLTEILGHLRSNNININNQKDITMSDTTLIDEKLSEIFIPEVSSVKGDTISFKDGIETKVLKDVNGEYFFVVNDKRHYYNDFDSTVNASYVYATKKIISNKGLKVSV